MKNKESAHNLFRLITCRNLDMNKLKAICFDHACSLHAYAMNREAREFEYVKTIVDTLHWKNHTACSSGFNAKLSTVLFAFYIPTVYPSFDLNYFGSVRSSRSANLRSSV